MYEKYSTNAIVCGSFDRNTSDKSYLLFTEAAGMVRAHATSVREERSKQRFALQDFSIVRVSLVQGKAGWKITGVEPIRNPFMDTDDRAVRTLVHATVRFLRRFISGEEAEPVLFAEAYGLLSESEKYATALDEAILVSSARFLYMLGYIAHTPDTAAVLTAPSIEAALQAFDDTQSVALDKVVKEAYTVSHL